MGKALCRQLITESTATGNSHQPLATTTFTTLFVWITECILSENQPFQKPGTGLDSPWATTYPSFMKAEEEQYQQQRCSKEPYYAESANAKTPPLETRPAGHSIMRMDASSYPARTDK